MGRLYYGNTTDAIELPDRMLAHLKVVASTKLRRSESFTVSWMDKSDAARGRATIWLHCSIPLRFEFDSADAEAIDRAYLERLAHEASNRVGAGEMTRRHRRVGNRVVDGDLRDEHHDLRPGSSGVKGGGNGQRW